jgi:rRNA maturation protein Nop10
MPRICNREGCGRQILTKDGSPDYRKHFCGAACLKIDKRERLQAKRSRLKGRRCPHCGRKSALAVVSLLPPKLDGADRHSTVAV